MATRSRSHLVVALLGGLFGVALVVGGAWSLISLSARQSFETSESYSGVRSLFVGTGDGDVRLTAARAGSAVVVRAHVTRGFRAPERKAVRTRGGGLRLTASCPDFFSDDCRVDYDIKVPSGTEVQIGTGNGDVFVSELAVRGRLRLSSGDGDLALRNVHAGSLDLSSGDGDINGLEVRARLIVAQSGDGTLSLDLPRPARSLTAQTGSGTVLLRVPDVTYALDASSGAGRVLADEVRRDPDSPRLIHASSGDASVIISVR